ncbi:MAG: rod shape-determining protein MreC, partial [Proteobacteria bacterium]|nr:rod shape-determining protein MreC [Pseudomonadota bacterium]
QSVLSLDGVVGQVNITEYSTSHVLLITDQSHAIPIEILRTGLRTLAYGTNELDHLSLPEIPVSADVQLGDVVVTSGFGNLYPRGLKLAEIEQISLSLNLSFKIAVATPFADLSKLTEVFLISPQTEESLNSGSQEQ